MKINYLIVSFTLLIVNLAQAKPIDNILKRWQKPSKDNVMVVAHRAAFMEGGQIILPENSLPSVQYAIELGVDMVEVDVRASKDGYFVLMHDATVDRTTNGSGKVSNFTLAELKKLRLVNEVTGQVTTHQIPTIEDLYQLVEGKIMVNIDPKIDIAQLAQTLKIAHQYGIEQQIVLKSGADTPQQLAKIQQVLISLPFEVDYMPMHWDKNFKSIGQIEASFTALKPEAAEMIVGLPNNGVDIRTQDGGVLFSSAVKKIAREHDTHLWINSLYIDPLRGRHNKLQWNGGRHDIYGLHSPEQVFGFWVEQGATIIQTDEPKFLMTYLKSKGYRH